MLKRGRLMVMCKNLTTRYSCGDPLDRNKRIPQKKTKEQYAIALEEAVPEMLLNHDDSYILYLMKDATDNDKWPKKFKSQKLNNFYLCTDIFVSKAMFYIDTEIKIILYWKSYKITIKSQKIELEPFPNIIMSKAFKERLNELQEVLKKLEEYRK